MRVLGCALCAVMTLLSVPSGAADGSGGAAASAARGAGVSVESLIETGRLDEAKVALDGALRRHPDDPQALFLAGEVARRQGRPREAIAQYRRILAERPDATRVRLELAVTLFAIEEDDAARHHFDLALAGGVPEATAEKIEAVLTEMRQRRRWRFDVSASLAALRMLNKPGQRGPGRIIRSNHQCVG